MGTFSLIIGCTIIPHYIIHLYTFVCRLCMQFVISYLE